uniref:Uncharacterized protein n=1 Tax=Macrostomum lignano TaxID=282301 RepID=A0A1I8HXP0_9PLAT
MPNIIYNLLKPLAVALTGQSHLQHHQHHQQSYQHPQHPQHQLLLGSGFVNAPRLTSAEGRRQRCSPTAAVDFRDDAAAAEATETVPMTATSGKSRWDEAAATVPDCSRLLRDSGSLLRTAGAPAGAGVLKPVTQSAAQRRPDLVRAHQPSSSGSAADPQLTYITLMACEQHGNSQQQQQQRSGVAEEKKLRIWSGAGLTSERELFDQLPELLKQGCISNSNTD